MHASINTVICQCNIINSNFDVSLNDLDRLVLDTGQSNNKAYTFKEMLKQDIAADCIKAVSKEARNHEYKSQGHWEIVNHAKIPNTIKTIQAIWYFKH